MANVQINSKILIRNDSAANWSTANPILSKGEMGIEIDTNKVKIGDGVTTWNSLSYFISQVNYSDMTGATSTTAGTSGLVPAPASGKESTYLKGDGTWSNLPSASTTAPGMVQLNDTVSSTSASVAATANAVKTAYDKANHNHPYAATSHLHPISDLSQIATGECTTAGATAAKTLTVTNFTLSSGVFAIVKFKETCSVASPTLNINSTGAVPICFNGAAVPANLIMANDIVTLLYDGTAWHISGVLDYGTTTTTLTSGGTGAVGTSPQIARADHTHTMPSIPSAGASSTALANDGTTSGGSATTWSKSDHTHALPKLLGNHFTAANDTAMIALSTAKKGDICFKSDNATYYVLNATPYSTLANWVKLTGSAAMKDVGTSSGNIPVLDASGKLSTSVLPSLSITNVYQATSQTAMLALSAAEVGDVCVRTDESKSYMLVATPYSTLTNWKDITNANAVSSVNGQTGTVSLNTSHIAESTNLYYTETRASASISSFFSSNTLIFNGGNATS